MNTNYIIVGVVLIGLFLYFKFKKPKNMKNINGTQFAELVGQENVVILDVRTAGECQSGMIPNAVNIDIMSAQFSTKIKTLDKDKTYLVYCRSGNRSGSACGAMEGMGFTDCQNLVGGVGSWTGKLV